MVGGGGGGRLNTGNAKPPTHKHTYRYKAGFTAERRWAWGSKVIQKNSVTFQAGGIAVCCLHLANEEKEERKVSGAKKKQKVGMCVGLMLDSEPDRRTS
jgi:hypothetical protein